MRLPVLPSAIAACSAAKSGHAVVVERNNLAVDERIGNVAAALAIALNLSVQSRPLRVCSVDVAILDPQLHAIAVELDLMAQPSESGGRSTEAHSCGAMKSGIAEAFFGFDGLRRRTGLVSGARVRGCLACRRRVGRVAAVGMPDGVGLRLAASPA